MESKGYRRFKDRLRYFKQDIEFTEIVVSNREMLKGDNAIFQRVSHDKFPILSKREIHLRAENWSLNICARQYIHRSLKTCMKK